MNRYAAFAITDASGMTDLGEIEADHFSINSSTSGAHFYRGDKTLVGTVPGGTVVKLVEDATVLEMTLLDLPEEIIHQVDPDEKLDDNQKIRVTVTIAAA